MSHQERISVITKRSTMPVPIGTTTQLSLSSVIIEGLDLSGAEHVLSGTGLGFQSRGSSLGQHQDLTFPRWSLRGADGLDEVAHLLLR